MQDVTKLFDLPQLLDNYEVPLKEFNHIDFIWGIDADQLVYERIYNIFNGFTKLDVEHVDEENLPEDAGTFGRSLSTAEEEEGAKKEQKLNWEDFYETVNMEFMTFPEN